MPLEECRASVGVRGTSYGLHLPTAQCQTSSYARIVPGRNLPDDSSSPILFSTSKVLRLGDSGHLTNTDGTNDVPLTAKLCCVVKSFSCG